MYCNVQISACRRVAVLALLLLLILSVLSLPTLAAPKDPVENSKLYNYDFNEEKGMVSILLDLEDAATGAVDLLPIFRNAASKGASLTIDLASVKLIFDRENTYVYAESGGKMPLTVQKHTNAEDVPQEIPFGDNVYALRVSFGNEFSPAPGGDGVGPFRIRCRYTTKQADNIRVIVCDGDGNETPLKSGYENGYVTFDSPAIAHQELLFCILDSEPSPTTPKLPFLLGGVLAIAVVLSAVLLVLIKTGKLRRWYLSRQ